MRAVGVVALLVGLSFTIGTPAFAYGPNGSTLTANTPSAPPGGGLGVQGSGFAPNSLVTLVLHSTPVGLGTVTADANGNFTDTVTIPADTPPGDHTIIATDPDGDSASTAIVVSGTVTTTASNSASGSTLAFTGADIAAMTTLGALALAVGGFLVLMGRKRRTVS